MAVRSDLASTIRTELATAGVTATVYDAPTDVARFPAVILEADDPYIVPETFKGGAKRWSLLIHVFTQRAEPASAYSFLEAARVAIDAAVRATPGGVPGQMSAPTGDRMNDIDLIRATITLDIVTTQEQ